MQSGLPSWARGVEEISHNPTGFAEDEGTESDVSESDFGGDDGGCCVECFGEPALRVFQSIVIVTVSVALLSVGAHGYALFTSGPMFKEAALRVCGVLFGLVVVLAELEVKRFLAELGILESWFTRGMFYANVGTLQLHMNLASTGETKFTQTELVISLAMLGCGVLYCLMGLMCLRHLKDASEIMQEHREKREQLRGSRSWDRPLDSATLAWPAS